MGPKVFISSTFYDLKYVREDIDEFVRNYRFETIMFENGDIGYVPGRPLDKSCYRYISKSDMVILIIGGQYGSPATGETKDDFTEYMSVTRKEFQAAMAAEVPIYAFIDSDVNAEYGVYKESYTNIEELHQPIHFNATKNINVFRFIKEIKSYPNVIVNSFQKTSDIKDYLSRQWAGYFLHYLELIREAKKEQEIENSLMVLKRNIDQINLMVDNVGKKLLGEPDADDYAEVKQNQTVSDIKNIFINSFSYIPLFKTYPEQCNFIKAFVKKVCEMLSDKTFYLHLSEDYDDVMKFNEIFKFDNAIIEDIRPGVELELKRYLSQLQLPIIQDKVVEELLDDESFCSIRK